jgi:hypothetical protein
MSEVTAALPRKILTSGERDFLKQGNRLLLDKSNGRIGATALMDLVADWGNHRGSLAFQEYARRWITEAQAKNKIADQLLRELFGRNEPDPRKAA